MVPLVEHAMRIALDAHKDQVRKTDGSPYVVHPLMVALILQRHLCADEIIAAGLVHDVLEDTSVTEAYLRRELGDVVTDYVVAVSEDKSLSWEERKKKYIETLRQAPEGAKAVSVADKIHNLQSLLRAHADMGSAVWNVFNRGKEQQIWFQSALLEMFKEVWRHPLVAEYERLVGEMKMLA